MSHFSEMLELLCRLPRRDSLGRKNQTRRKTLRCESLEDRRLLAHYFVDAVSGSDENPGTSDAPLRSYLPFVSAYGQSDPNVGRIDLEAGDVVEFAPGTYTSSFELPNGTDFGFYLRGVHGTEDNPIRIIASEGGVVIDAQPPDGGDMISMSIENSSHLVIEGLEFTGYGKAVRLAGTQNVIVRDNWFHDIDGRAEGNLAGLEIHSSDEVEVYNNLFQDNYDRSQRHQNSRHIVLFSNRGHIHVHHNYLENATPTSSSQTGAGIDVKHGEDGSYEANHNIIVNASSSSLGTSTARSFLHHNLIIDSESIQVRDLGGAAYFNDIVISNNTQVSRVSDAGGGLTYNPRDFWYSGIREAYREGDLQWHANRWNGQPRDGAIEVTGSFFVHHDWYNESEEHNLGPLRSGMLVPADREGEGYVMFSVQDVHSRFAADAPNAQNSDHLVVVRWSEADSGKNVWEYSTGSEWVEFTPEFSDLLLATVDLPSLTLARAGSDTVQPLTATANARHGRPIPSFNDIGTLEYSDNLVLDSRQYNADRSSIRISTYGPDRLYEKVVEGDKLIIDDNVYHVPEGQPQFQLFNANNGGSRGVKGDTYDLAGWQELGYGTGSLDVNPNFDDAFLPKNAAAAGAGWYADEAARLTVLVTGEDRINEGDSTQAVIVRSGESVDISQSLTVALSASDPSQVTLPASVTFAAGESKAYFTITGTWDGIDDGTRVSRIAADAPQFSDNVSAWVRVANTEGTPPPEDLPPVAPPPNENPSNETPPNENPPSETPPNNDPPNVPVDPVDHGDPGQQHPDIQFTNYQGGIWTVPGASDQEFVLSVDWIERLGEYDNELGLYLVDDEGGSVNGLVPGDAGYASAALLRADVLLESGSGAGDHDLAVLRGGDRVAFYMIQNATTDAFLADNPENDVAGRPLAFFSIGQANPDNIEHVIVSELGDGQLRFGWEDLLHGGDRSFRDAVIDAILEENQVITIPETPTLVDYSVQATDGSGNPLSSLREGDEFFLEVRVEDRRDIPTGVFSAYVDIQYNDEVANINGPIEFGEAFTGAQNADASVPGLVDEAGGLSGLDRTGGDPMLLLRVPMLATREGTFTASSRPADLLPAHETLLFGEDAPVDRIAINSGLLSLPIEARNTWLQNPADFADVNDDDHISPLDALMVINFLHRHGEIDVPDSPQQFPDVPGYLDVTGDQRVSALDALRVINELSRANRVAATGEAVRPLAEHDAIAQSSDVWREAVDLAHTPF